MRPWKALRCRTQPLQARSIIWLFSQCSSMMRWLLRKFATLELIREDWLYRSLPNIQSECRTTNTFALPRVNQLRDPNISGVLPAKTCVSSSRNIIEAVYLFALTRAKVLQSRAVDTNIQHLLSIFVP